MTVRKVTDEDGRTWECKVEDPWSTPGRDVSIVCTTKTVPGPLTLKVSWQWAKMAEKGLARLIAAAAPLPAK